jgi:predicted nucleotidyltransferase component of viral defense system
MLSIIEQRLKKYEINTETQQENALKEITQEIILGALAKANFFEVGIFHGGTSLRILYGISHNPLHGFRSYVFYIFFEFLIN